MSNTTQLDPLQGSRERDPSGNREVLAHAGETLPAADAALEFQIPQSARAETMGTLATVEFTPMQLDQPDYRAESAAAAVRAALDQNHETEVRYERTAADDEADIANAAKSAVVARIDYEHSPANIL